MVRAALAATPIAAVLVLMVGARWSAVRAGLAAAVVTLGLAVAAFDLGGPAMAHGRAEGLAGIAAEAAWTTATIVAIIGPALGVHHLQQRTGATEVLRAGLTRLSPDPRVAALLVAWFFSLFMEGAAGFGTPVALAAPFLVAAGFQPVMAVTAALIGHAAGVSFGAVGTPVMAQVAATDFTGGELAAATAPYHTVLGWILIGAVAVIVGRAVPGVGPPWGWATLAGVAFFVPFALIGRFVGPELPTLGGAMLGTTAFVTVVLALRRTRRDRTTSPPDAPSGDTGSLARASAPYLTLVAVVLLTRLVPPVRDLLFGVELEWRLFDVFSGTVRPLYHPGVLLPLAFLAAALAQHASWVDVRRAVATTNGQLAPVVVALLAMVTIARTMSHAGMIDELALVAAGAGTAWPLLAPAVGALGTFVTGSATASNILFTDLQVATAEAVGHPPLPVLGAQGFGAAVGNIVCPHNVVAAAATVGLAGREGDVLRRTLPVALVYVVLGGGLALWFAR